MKRYILKLLLWLYRDVVKDFTKLTSGEEFYLYKFGNQNDVVKLIKYLQTSQILWYYEAKTEEERNIVKGSSLMLKIILDSHNQVLDIMGKNRSEEEQLNAWDNHRKRNRTT